MPQRDMKHDPNEFCRQELPRYGVRRLALLSVLGLTALAAVFLAVRLTMETPGNAGNAITKAIVDDQDLVISSIKVAGSGEPSLDPKADGWPSEAFAEDAKVMLLQLLERLDSHQSADAGKLTAIVSDQFQCTELFPQSTKPVFEDDLLKIIRAEATDPVWRYRGQQGLVEALGRLALPFVDATNVQSHAKVVRVLRREDGSWKTQALIESTGEIGSGSCEQHSRWSCEWANTAAGGLQLKSIVATDFQQAISNKNWFVDCTAAALANAKEAAGQLSFGLNHWLRRIERARGIHVFARCGLAVGDVNGDGSDDLYVCQPGGLPNRLLLQNSDGTVADVSHASGCDWLDHTSSALLIDLDNDSDQDLVLATVSGLVIMANDGDCQFKVRNRLPITDSDVQSLAAADYDNDGDLDLFLCVDFAKPFTQEAGFLYHDANDGGRNVLFRNDTTGDQWEFVDVTDKVGLSVNNQRHSLAASWEDYDNDGDQDLYVANDYGQNCLYRNDDGHFVEIASEAGVVDLGSGMSSSWGDYNRDGSIDLYVGNMFSSAGNRITRQAAIQRQSRTNRHVDLQSIRERKLAVQEHRRPLHRNQLSGRRRNGTLGLE